MLQNNNILRCGIEEKEKKKVIPGIPYYRWTKRKDVYELFEIVVGTNKNNIASDS